MSTHLILAFLFFFFFFSHNHSQRIFQKPSLRLLAIMQKETPKGGESQVCGKNTHKLAKPTKILIYIDNTVHITFLGFQWSDIIVFLRLSPPQFHNKPKAKCSQNLTSATILTCKCLTLLYGILIR